MNKEILLEIPQDHPFDEARILCRYSDHLDSETLRWLFWGKLLTGGSLVDVLIYGEEVFFGSVHNPARFSDALREGEAKAGNPQYLELVLANGLSPDVRYGIAAVRMFCGKDIGGGEQPFLVAGKLFNKVDIRMIPEDGVMVSWLGGQARIKVDQALGSV